jgi:hypothetical protein
VTQPAWQHGRRQQQSFQVRDSHAPRRRRVSVAVALALFVALAALLVYYVVRLPTKTPVVAAYALDYRWPLPPNSWTWEDVDDLRQRLDEQTVALRTLAWSGESSGAAAAALGRQLQEAAPQVSRRGVVVVYVSAHGVVDGQDRPCLLLPGADPLDSGTWLPVADLLEQFRTTPLARGGSYLLVLDCNRLSSNWSIGLLENTFAERLAQLVRQADVPGLAVLNSTAAGQVASTSIHLQNSVFGHFFQLGLAGAADGDGDADGRVSLYELRDYVRRQVDDWTQRHRAQPQTPLLLPADVADVQISWSLNKRDLKRLLAADAQGAGAAEQAALDRLEPLWQKHQQLEAFHAHHYGPMSWQGLEHQLLWLEQAAMSGQAYRESCEQTAQRIRAQLDRAWAVAAPSGTPSDDAVSPIQFAVALAGNDVFPLRQADVASRGVAAYLGLAQNSDVAAPATAYSEDQLAALFDWFHLDQLWPDDAVRQATLGLHRRGEQLAAPHAVDTVAADARAHTLIRPLLDDCDTTRRGVEDAAFLGSELSPDLPSQIAAAQQKHDTAVAVATALARAYQVRDRAWVELPYLARWSRRHDQSGPSGNAGLRDDVLALIVAANSLDQTLRRAEPASPQDAGDLSLLQAIADAAATPASQIATALDGLQQVLDDQARRLQAAPVSCETLADIADLLALPLVSGKSRALLLTRYLEVAGAIDGGQEPQPGSAADTGPTSPPAEPGDGAANGDRAVVGGEQEPQTTHWRIHPVVAILHEVNDTVGSQDDVPLTLLGEQLRDAMHRVVLGLPDSAARDAGGPSSETDDAGLEPEEQAWDLFAAERRMRRFVALLGAEQAVPYQQLGNRYLQRLLLWNARRRLDDFWASVQPGQRPYFADAAEGCLTAARLLAKPAPQEQRLLRDLQDLLQQRSAAAERGLATTATDLILVDSNAEATVRIGVHPTETGQGLPAGRGAVYLRDDQAPLAATIRELPIEPATAAGNPAAREIAVRVAGPELSGRGPTLRAVAMLRGHEFAAPMMSGEVAGTRVDVVRERYETSSITVQGPRFKPAPVVFILDCSQSMGDGVAVEAPDPGGLGLQPTKLNVAIDALRGMMTRLGQRGDHLVGVRYFGHRVGWRTGQLGVLERREDYPGGVPPALQPYEDVELFLPLGRFDIGTAARVNRSLASLAPWGESPIYHALMKSLRDFDVVDQGDRRRVVVITDGANYQFNPPPESAPTRQEVEAAYTRQGIAIDIVGFAIDAAEQTVAAQELGQLAAATGGDFIPAENASALVRTLERFSERTQFQVVQSGRVVAQDEVGETVVVPVDKGGSSTVTIQLEQLQAVIELEGGEALQLVPDQDGQRLITPVYDQRHPLFAPLVTPSPRQATGYRVGAHQPLRTDQAVVFPISFQREDLGIPARLRQVWIEITPVLGSGTAATQTYLFYDARYEPDLPVPLLNCSCRDWPREAVRASLRVWCLPEAVEPAESVPLEEVADQSPPAGEGFPLARLPGVGYQVRRLENTASSGGTRVRVVQRHEITTPVNAVKLELQPAPVRIQHQYDWDHGIVLHTFDYDPQALPAGASVTLRFQAREDFVEQAWRIEQPIVLSIARHNDVVVPPEIIAPGDRVTEDLRLPF